MKNPLVFQFFGFSFCFLHLLRVSYSQSIFVIGFQHLISKNSSSFVWDFDILFPCLEFILCLCWPRVNLLFSSPLSDWVETFVRKSKGLWSFSFDLWAHISITSLLFDVFWFLFANLVIFVLLVYSQRECIFCFVWGLLLIV